VDNTIPLKKVTAFLFLLSLSLQAQTFETLVSNSNTFLASLTESQRESMNFDFRNESRTKWTNLPVGMMPRKGVKIGEFSAESKVALHHVFTTVLSSQGYLKVTGIMTLDDILNMIYKDRLDKGEISENQYKRMMDLDWERDNFFVSFYGTPDLKEPWGINIGGHHIGFHITAGDGDFSMTPLFLGTDPSEVLTTEYAGLRVLSKEEDYGFLFISALNEAQKAKATQTIETPKDIVTSPDRPQMITKYSGIKASELNSSQKELLEVVIKEYINNLNFGKAKEAFSKIEAAGFDNIYFSWIGSYEPHQNHYYVINGPTFLIEYDNAGFQSKADHIHCIYREKGNDFGEDILKSHYSHHKH
jgi:hypothetical protein